MKHYYWSLFCKIFSEETHTIIAIITTNIPTISIEFVTLEKIKYSHISEKIGCEIRIIPAVVAVTVFKPNIIKYHPKTWLTIPYASIEKRFCGELTANDSPSNLITINNIIAEIIDMHKSEMTGEILAESSRSFFLRLRM
tara:strand:- start:50 stop:469 length:420 start_codon:yes stop_codon:yes gene_type:complete